MNKNLGRKLRKHKVHSTELGDYIERVVRNFVKQREQGERFMGERLGPILERLGSEAAARGDDFAPPDRESWYELHHVLP